MIDCCAKYMLCGFNFLILLAGSAVLGIGVWLAVDKSSFIGLITLIPNEHFQDLPKARVIEQIAFILISIGSLMFTVSFLGYCGVLRKSKCMLTSYGLCLMIILVLEVTVLCIAMIYKTRAEDEVKDSLKLSISHYYSKSEDGDIIKSSWDRIQVALHCCGVDNYTDYQKSKDWSYDAHKVIPESCCVLDDKNKPLSRTCTISPNDTNSYYKKGCFHAVLNWMMTHSKVLIVIAAVLLLVEVFGICFSFHLSKSFRRPWLVK